MDLYAENILEHYRHPHGQGHLEKPSITHEELNMNCGDMITVELELDGSKIKRIRWEGKGCAISIAGISMLSEAVEGKTFDEIEQWKVEDMISLLGVPVGLRRYKCALLGLHGIKNAVRKYRGTAMGSWFDTAGTLFGE